MKTPILDKYIFSSFEKIKGISIDSIEFNFKAEKQVDKNFIISLFENLDVTLIESEVRKNETVYKLTINWFSEITSDEYALLLGKVHMLCGKLYMDLTAAGLKV